MYSWWLRTSQCVEVRTSLLLKLLVPKQFPGGCFLGKFSCLINSLKCLGNCCFLFIIIIIIIIILFSQGELGMSRLKSLYPKRLTSGILIIKFYINSSIAFVMDLLVKEMSLIIISRTIFNHLFNINIVIGLICSWIPWFRVLPFSY